MPDRDKKRLVCQPEAYERIRALVADQAYGEYYIITTSEAVPPGTAIMLPSDAEFDAYMQRLGEQLLDGLAEKLRQSMAEDQERIEADLRRETELRRQAIYAGLVRERMKFGMVSGL